MSSVIDDTLLLSGFFFWLGGKRGVQSVESVECGKCGVWKMRSVENEKCGKCGVWKMIITSSPFSLKNIIFLTICKQKN